MDDGDITIAAEMGMGISIGRLAMGGPTSMGDTDSGINILIGAESFKIAHLAFSLKDTDLTITIDQRHTGAIISAILETVQALNQDVIDITITEITNYSTHIKK